MRHEWKRIHHIKDFDQVGSRAYIIHFRMKYPKFGHATATDYASKFIRYGMITRDEGIQLLKKYDHDLDKLAVRDFCEFLGYSIKEVWDIVDKFYNQDLFDKNFAGEWQLKNPVWE